MEKFEYVALTENLQPAVCNFLYKEFLREIERCWKRTNTVNIAFSERAFSELRI